ncbi:hypothetical protein GDO81_024006 [Engystomops pustulosus]|uniref:Uncharacterized protein n=1 Tax=Engystomops pustulosus TaxID=76066 RepID=A0AAV6YVB7_ENGPU|nr:hypothetical protein GDO81_024006 [Engystomops pustulosus]
MTEALSGSSLRKHVHLNGSFSCFRRVCPDAQRDSVALFHSQGLSTNTCPNLIRWMSGLARDMCACKRPLIKAEEHKRGSFSK